MNRRFWLVPSLVWPNRSGTVWFVRCGEANREGPAQAELRPTATVGDRFDDTTNFHYNLLREAESSQAAYSIAPYASVQKSVNTFGGSGESIRRCVKRMPIIPSAGSV